MVCYGKKTVVYRIAILPSLHLQPKKKKVVKCRMEEM